MLTTSEPPETGGGKGDQGLLAVAKAFHLSQALYVKELILNCNYTVNVLAIVRSCCTLSKILIC